MKILRIIRSANPESGGVIESVVQMSIATEKLGHQIEILCLDDPNSYWLKKYPIKIHAVGPAKLNYGYCNTLSTWLTANYHFYDKFIIDGIWQYHSLASSSVLRQVNHPYYVYTHGMLDPWFKKQYPLKHLKKWLYWPWGDYRVLRDAEKVFFTAEEEKILARKSFWLYKCNEQIATIGTAGVQGERNEQVGAFYNNFPHLKNRSFLLFLSRIHPKKGIDLLLKAFAETKKNHPELELVIAGPDQVGWCSELKLLAESLGISKKITWSGMLKGDLKWGAYQSAEAFILPSHQENFGIVVAEALSCSVPVLTTNKVNIWREIEQDNAGLIAEDTLLGCIDLLNRWRMIDSGDRAKMKENAHQCFINRFEINSAAQSLINALKD